MERLQLSLSTEDPDDVTHFDHKAYGQDLDAQVRKPLSYNCSLEEPMPFRDRVEVSFDAGHRLLGHQGKCSAPHGRTCRAEVFVEGETINEMGLVIDFVDLKRPLKEWIDRSWNHAFLVNSDDVALVNALDTVAESKVYRFLGVNP